MRAILSRCRPWAILSNSFLFFSDTLIIMDTETELPFEQRQEETNEALLNMLFDLKEEMAKLKRDMDEFKRRIDFISPRRDHQSIPFPKVDY